eukprot:scaffold4659_cov125-Isochrysis_galbana.AAC.9
MGALRVRHCVTLLAGRCTLRTRTHCLNSGGAARKTRNADTQTPDTRRAETAATGTDTDRPGPTTTRPPCQPLHPPTITSGCHSAASPTHCRSLRCPQRPRAAAASSPHPPPAALTRRRAAAANSRTYRHIVSTTTHNYCCTHASPQLPPPPPRTPLSFGSCRTRRSAAQPPARRGGGWVGG